MKVRDNLYFSLKCSHPVAQYGKGSARTGKFKQWAVLALQ